MNRPDVDRAEGVERELELGHDAEVAAAAAQRPEQLRVAVLAGDHHAAVRGHDDRAHEVVAGEPGRAHQEPDAAAQGQAADPGIDERAAGRRQPVRRRGAVDVLPQRPAAGPGASPLRIHA